MPTIKAETTKKSRIPKNSGANKRKEPLKEKANPKPKCPTNSSTAAGFSLVGNDCDSGINGALPNGMLSYLFCLIDWRLMKTQYSFNIYSQRSWRS